MKIINDTEVYEPSECYFDVVEDGTHITIPITPIVYWNEDQCLDDGFGDHSLDSSIMQKLNDADIGFEMEATMGTSLSIDEARKVMLDLGFVEFKFPNY